MSTPIVKPAMQHNCSGQDVPVYVVDIGSRRVVVAQEHVQTR